MLVQWLTEIQKRQGFLTRDDLTRVALRAGVPLYQVQEFASFFPSYRFEKDVKTGKDNLKPILHVCQSMVCHLKWVQAGVPRIRDVLEVLSRNPVPPRDESEEVGRVRTILGQSPGCEIRGVSCLGRCDRAPVAMQYEPLKNRNPIYHEHIRVKLGPNDASHSEVGNSDSNYEINKNLWSIDPYNQNEDRYKSLKEVLGGFPKGSPEEQKDPREAVARRLEAGKLIGLGGAGAATWKKWEEAFTDTDHVKYVVANGDESEPGTFKDREIMLRHPHLVIEGVLLAAFYLRAARAFIYVRHEYYEQYDALVNELNRLKGPTSGSPSYPWVTNLLASHPIDVIMSPGRYICGEETALLEVLEGNRAQPRNKPPATRLQGLHKHPTVVNNVETFARIPALFWPLTPVIREGPPKSLYAVSGDVRPRSLYAVSGDVRCPGVYEMDTTCTLGDLYDAAGGGPESLYPGDREGLFAVAPSGASGGFLPAKLIKQPQAKKGRDKIEQKQIDILEKEIRDSINQKKYFNIFDLPLITPLLRSFGFPIGPAVVFYGSLESVRMMSHAQNCTEFFSDESCGKCVPCRLGSYQLVHLGIKLALRSSIDINEQKLMIDDLASTMRSTSICGLGEAASNPLTTHNMYFLDVVDGPLSAP